MASLRQSLCQCWRGVFFRPQLLNSTVLITTLPPRFGYAAARTEWHASGDESSETEDPPQDSCKNMSSGASADVASFFLTETLLHHPLSLAESREKPGFAKVRTTIR